MGSDSRLRCPLCGEENHCTGAVASAPHQPCWCTTVHIAKETIARIPRDRLGICICPNCANGGKQSASDFISDSD